jgi:hypothetical protein
MLVAFIKFQSKPLLEEVRVELSLCLIKHHDVKTYGEMEVWLHVYLT